MVEDLWILKNGVLELDQSILTSGIGMGNTLNVPVFSVLVKTEDTYVLVDTGLNTSGIDDPFGIWGERARKLKPILEKEDDVKNRIQELGISPSEISHIITTHMHWDHTGGNKHFKHAEVVVQKAEYRFAFYPDKHLSGSYMKNHYDFGEKQKYRLIEGDYQFDSGIDILFTPGHTPGHQSILITRDDGKKFIISGDAIYTKENIEKLIPPGNCWDMPQALLSMQKLISISKQTDAVIIPSHDPDPNFYSEVNEKIEKYSKI